MNSYKAFDARSAIVATICTVLLSTTLILSAVGPVNAATPTSQTAPSVRPLA